MSGPAGQLKGRAARLARLMPSGSSSAARTPFVLLVVLLLGGGLITLLLLNSALNEGSFRLSELKKRTTELTDEEQALQRDVDGRSEPDALERRARKLGMVPGGSPAFLNPDGTFRGVPSEAVAQRTRAPAAAPPAGASPSKSAPPPAMPSASATSPAMPSASATSPAPPATKPSTSAAPPAQPPTPAHQSSTSPGR
ncbi:FtsB family cell division protein [Streptomyces sp. NBC_01800]|uniref:FtsB family cell division protein n=1 Tax=Streptomyces sp. NBC_01800 TaxID=2975945 RepID=UPI002DD7F3E1|nr:septum formation initiator [Streptomyces sp. NBC_01800]WSA67693.1 septum formation initiator family protein [Streptomyces sp. NBC_01800]